MRRVAIEKGGILGMDAVQAKCSADAARHSLRRRNSNECFGVCGRTAWDFPGSDMKWMTDWLLVRGVNLLIPHAFYYSIRSPRHLERPPDVGPNSIWWPHYKQHADYVSRLSWLMTDSRNAAQIAVLCESRQMPADSLVPLYEQQVEFNYLPLSLLKEARLEEGALNLHGYRYTHYLPLHDEQLPLERIDPQGSLPRDLIADPPSPLLRASHILKDGQHVYLLVNEGEEELRTGLSLPIEGSPYYYDAWRDRLWQSPVDDFGRIQLQLMPYESLALILDQEGALEAPALVPPAVFQLNQLARLKDEDSAAIVKHYEARLHVDRLPAAVELWLMADDMVELWCNGRFLGASFWNPHRFDATEALKPGMNQILFRVTGSLGNRYGSPVPYGIRTAES